jgi:hypothetical protein
MVQSRIRNRSVENVESVSITMIVLDFRSSYKVRRLAGRRRGKKRRCRAVTTTASGASAPMCKTQVDIQAFCYRRTKMLFLSGLSMTLESHRTSCDGPLHHADVEFHLSKIGGRSVLWRPRKAEIQTATRCGQRPQPRLALLKQERATSHHSASYLH